MSNKKAANLADDPEKIRDFSAYILYLRALYFREAWVKKKALKKLLVAMGIGIDAWYRYGFTGANPQIPVKSAERICPRLAVTLDQALAEGRKIVEICKKLGLTLNQALAGGGKIIREGEGYVEKI